MRYRLVPAKRGDSHWHVAWHAPDLTDARATAQAFHAEHHMAVLICEAPTDGIVRHVETIGGVQRNTRRR